MLIERVNIPKDHGKADGLDAIQMDRLKKVVIVAGKNGSGKTRLLNKVTVSFQDGTFKNIVESFPVHKGRYDEKKMKLLQEISLWNEPAKHADDPSERSRRTEQLEKEVSTLDSIFKNKTDELQRQVLGISGNLTGWKIVPYVPKHLGMPDPGEMTGKGKKDNAQTAHTLGLGNVHAAALAKIQDLHDQHRDATHSEPSGTLDERNKIIAEYKKLNGIIKELLGVEITNGPRGSAMLFGHALGQAGFSDGQKVLLQLAIAIHCQGGALSNIILMMDEPENHLHPKAVIEVLEKLIEKIPDGQIWIATHSVSLIAHFSDQASLWFMDSGKVSAAGKIQEKVLESLLGDSSRIAKQKEFLERPDALALVRFTQECLTPPTVIATNKPGDPQTAQIRDAIQKLRVGSAPLKVLDYGAGKGRLLANMAEEMPPADIAAQIDYVAFDPSDQDKASCLTQISQVYGNADGRWCCAYDGNNGILESHSKGSFDLIVLCNVLHEINPKDWRRLFGSEGELTQLLKDGGQLLMVEVQKMPIGEHAHEFGFLVLDTGALKDLFCVTGTTPFPLDSRRDGRLKAHLVSKAMLGAVTTESIKRSISSHKQHAEAQIKLIRGRKNKDDGLLFAFWMVQYANATMALQEI